MQALHPAFAELEPRVALAHLSAMFGIVRPSHQENELIWYIVQWAKSKGYEAKIDTYNNLSVFVPATRGYESVPAVCLQTHTDMVYVQQPHAVEIEVVDGWIRSKDQKTTVGLDNAAGMVLAMDVAETAVHGPLYLLFTSSEEDDMSGCHHWRPEDHNMQNCRLLINVDTPIFGKIGTSCAGFVDVVAKLPVTRVPRVMASPCYRLEVSGFAGGHSGDNVADNRGNALKVLGELLSFVQGEWRLTKIGGGEAGNSIPAKAFAEFNAVGSIDSERMSSFLEAIAESLERPDIQMSLSQCDTSPLMEQGVHDAILQAFRLIPTGVVRMDPTVAGLPMLSTTLALVREEEGNIIIQSIVRGSDGDQMRDFALSVKQRYQVCGFEAEFGAGANGWLQSPDSSLVRAAIQSFESIDVQAAIAGFHCSLEPGELVGPPDDRRFDQAISIGPTVLDEHAVTERGRIQDLVRIRAVLTRILKEIMLGNV